MSKGETGLVLGVRKAPLELCGGWAGGEKLETRELRGQRVQWKRTRPELGLWEKRSRDRAERVSRNMGLGLMAVEVMGVGEQCRASRLGWQ